MKSPLSRCPAVIPAIALAAGVIASGTLGSAAYLPVIVAVAAVVASIFRRFSAAFWGVAFVSGWILASIAAEPYVPQVSDTAKNYTVVVDDSRISAESIRIIGTTAGRKPELRMAITCRNTGEDIRCGDTVSISTRLHPLKAQRKVPYEIDYDIYLLQSGVTHTGVADTLHLQGHGHNIVGRLRSKWFAAIADAPLDANAATMLLAVTSADRTWLHPDITGALREAGLAHLLAISGFHVGVVVALISFALLPMIYFRSLRKVRKLIILALLWAYIVFTGMATPAVRAGIMASVGILAWMMDRRSSPANALAVAAIVILVCNPLDIYTAGFQLSFAAVAGILCFGRSLNLVPDRFVALRRLVGMFTVCIGAMVGTCVFTVFWFHRLPLGSLPANVLAAIVFPVFMVSGCGAALCHSWGAIASFLGWIADKTYTIIIYLADCTNSLGINVENVFLTTWQAIAFAAGIIALGIAVNVKGKGRIATLAAGVILLCLTALLRVAPPAVECYAIPWRGSARLMCVANGEAMHVVPNPSRHAQSALSIPGGKYARYLQSRGCPDSIRLLHSDFDRGVIRRHGADLIVGDKVVTILGATPDSLPSRLHRNYLLVVPGYRGDAQRDLGFYAPDTLILAPGLTASTSYEWRRQAASTGTPVADLADGAIKLWP